MPAPRKNAPKSSVASAASDQVRAIVEAAEAAAAQIRAEAQEEAERIRGEARREASEILGGLRTGIERLLRDLGLESGTAMRAAAAKREIDAPAPPDEPALPVAASATDDDPEIQLAEDAAVGLDEDAAVGLAEAGPPAAGATSAEDPQRESARLVALNMALSGAPREEVDGYLSENFSLENRAALLDEVYAMVGR
jgi:cell division septum initiation protein DivIVA